MKIAALFHQAGYAVLTFDFRSHGESQRGLCAGGLMEDQDVMGAVDYAFQRLTTEASTATPIVGIVGFGLGAAAALAAVGREKGGTEVIHVFSGDSEGGSAFVAIEPPNVKRLRFLVAVEPASMGAWLRELLYPRIGVLYRLVVPLVEWLCQRRGGFPLGITRLLRFVQEVHIPVLVVKGCAGSCPKHAEAQQVYEAIPGEKQLWQIEGVKGAMQTYQCIEQHPERILAFASLHVDMRSSSL
jgi:pimeloyl-ACP methyl ester carboxylesterase